MSQKALDNVYMTQASNTPVGQGLYETTTNQNQELGYRLALADGRVFRYCSNGSVALAAGVLLQSQASIHAMPASAAATSYNNLACPTASAIDSDKLYVTSTTTHGTGLSANRFSNGYALVTDSYGAGHMYKVAGNTAAAAAATTVTVNLKDPVRVATTTASKITLIQSLYKSVIVSPGTPTGPIIGLAPTTVAASSTTNTYYFWAQTRGPACAYLDSTTAIVVNTQATRGGTTYVGAVRRQLDASTAGVIEQPVGYFLDAIATTYKGKYAVIFLTID
jgi:hypothetical protein